MLRGYGQSDLGPSLFLMKINVEIYTLKNDNGRLVVEGHLE